MHRCGLIAEGLLWAEARGVREPEARLAILRERLTAYGLDPDRLERNPTSRYPYRLDSLIAGASRMTPAARAARRHRGGGDDRLRHCAARAVVRRSLHLVRCDPDHADAKPRDQHDVRLPIFMAARPVSACSWRRPRRAAAMRCCAAPRAARCGRRLRAPADTPPSARMASMAAPPASARHWCSPDTNSAMPKPSRQAARCC